MPTSSALGRIEMSDLEMICCKMAGAILQPQPPPCDSEVRRGMILFASVGAFTSYSIIEIYPGFYAAGQRLDLGASEDSG